MTITRPTPRAEQLLLWALVGLAVIARFVHLDSDPKFEYWIFYVEDEGRWIETARNLALFGEPGLYGISKLHLLLSPLFQAVNYLIFQVAGVSFWSARIWSAACGAGIVVLSLLLLSKVTKGFPLYLGLAILALEPLTLSLSRTALPEVPSLFFTLFAFTAICTWQRRIVGAISGGLLLAIACAMKGTTLLMAPVFLLIVALSGASEPARQRLTRCAGFLLGLLLPAVIGLAVALAAGIIDAAAFSALWPSLRKSLALGGLYSIVARFAGSDTAFGNVNLLLLGAWVGSWIVIFRKEYRGTLLGKIYELSGIWAAGWFVVWAPIEYTPTRYSVHMILPLTINIVAGIALWRTIGVARVVTGISALRTRWGIAYFAWLVLPAAIVTATLILTVIGLAGVPNDRLAYKLFAIVAVAVVLVVLARATRPPENAVTGFIGFAVIVALLGMTIQEVGSLVLSRPQAEQALPVVKLVATAGVALWYWLKRSAPIAAQAGKSALAVSYALVAGGVFLQAEPELIQTTYSIRDASRNTAQLFPDATLLQSSGAGALLLETRIPYRDAIAHGTSVDGILNYDRHVRPGAGYSLAARYRLVVHPRYYSMSRPLMESGNAVVEVYRAVQQPTPAVEPVPPASR